MEIDDLNTNPEERESPSVVEDVGHPTRCDNVLGEYACAREAGHSGYHQAAEGTWWQ